MSNEKTLAAAVRAYIDSDDQDRVAEFDAMEAALVAHEQATPMPSVACRLCGSPPPAGGAQRVCMQPWRKGDACTYTGALPSNRERMLEAALLSIANGTAGEAAHDWKEFAEDLRLQARTALGIRDTAPEREDRDHPEDAYNYESDRRQEADANRSESPNSSPVQALKLALDHVIEDVRSTACSRYEDDDSGIAKDGLACWHCRSLVVSAAICRALGIDHADALNKVSSIADIADIGAGEDAYPHMAAPSSGVTPSDEERAQRWLWPYDLYEPGNENKTVASLVAMLADVRRETIEACIRIASSTPGGADSYRDMRERIVRALSAQFTRSDVKP